MNKEVSKLIKQYKEELTLRDGGEAAKKTWKQIEKIATAKEQVKILKDSLG